jgi:hypothetical protein
VGPYRGGQNGTYSALFFLCFLTACPLQSINARLEIDSGVLRSECTKKEQKMSVTKLNRIVGMLAVADTVFGTTVVLAQNAAPSSMKTIGAPAAAAKPEIVPSLFVLNSRGATLQGDTPTLTGVMPHSVIARRSAFRGAMYAGAVGAAAYGEPRYGGPPSRAG